MTKHFHEELDEIKGEVVKMGELSRYMLQKSVEALVKRDLDLAEDVLSKKTSLAQMDDHIEERCLALITLQQPMAKDMRTIATCLKLITYITRIGRYGKDIAKVVKETAGAPHIKKLVSIPHMCDITVKMMDDSMDAFRTEDLSKIKDLSERDDDVDSLRFSIFRECLTYMMEDGKTIPQCTNYIIIARYLERCADHTCKIAEKVHYMVTGERIEIK